LNFEEDNVSSLSLSLSLFVPSFEKVCLEKVCTCNFFFHASITVKAPKALTIIYGIHQIKFTHNDCISIKQRGVYYTVGLAIYMKKYLKAKEELWKLKYFTMQKYNLQLNPLKETKILQDTITNLKFQQKPKYHLSKSSYNKNRPFISCGPKSIKLLYSIMNLNTISLRSSARPTNETEAILALLNLFSWSVVLWGQFILVLGGYQKQEQTNVGYTTKMHQDCSGIFHAYLKELSLRELHWYLGSFGIN
jgi:hypothetical protein